MYDSKPNAGTFSIIGYDPLTEEWGIAIQSKLLAIGALAPWAKAGVGAVVTQAFINPSFGETGLKYLSQGFGAKETLFKLIENDSDAALRQIGIMDAHGNTAVYTGELCPEYAGSQQGRHYLVQGNLLVSSEVLNLMSKRFSETAGPLAERLLSTLKAGQHAGGDRRGKQGAALLVVKLKAGYYGSTDRFIDLRVDDHPSPITELERLYRLHQLYFSPSESSDIVAINAEMQTVLLKILIQENFIAASENYSQHELYQALIQFHRNENLLGRLQSSGFIDKQVYNFMLKRFL